MVLLSEGSSVKESPEDKQACAPCVRGSAKISQQVTLALYTGQVQPAGDPTWWGGGVPTLGPSIRPGWGVSRRRTFLYWNVFSLVNTSHLQRQSLPLPDLSELLITKNSIASHAALQLPTFPKVVPCISPQYDFVQNV